MKIVSIACSVVFLTAPVLGADQPSKRSTVDHPNIAALLQFLVGSWVSTADSPKAVEAWTCRQDGFNTGILVGVRETDIPQLKYQLFSVEPSDPNAVLFMRELNVSLRDSDWKYPTVIGNISSDRKDQAILKFKSTNGDFSCTFAYRRLTPEKLDLEVQTTEHGTITTEIYHYKRAEPTVSK